MDAWHILTVGCVCAVGALTFLKIVTDELDARTSELRAFRRREEKRGRGPSPKAPADTLVAEKVTEEAA